MNEVNVAQRFVFLLSHERSGSHFMTDMLVNTGCVRSLDEVCNFKAIDPEKSRASFYRYRFETANTDPDILLRPSPESMSRLLDGYMAQLDKLVGADKKILIDIKYGHVHNFEVGWWPSERRPFLFAWLEKEKIPVVHLSRRDSLASAVSNILAEMSDVWHALAECEKSIKQTKIPPLRAVHDALLLDREKMNFANWLAGTSCRDVEYEEIAGEESVRNSAMAALCEFLQIQPPPKFESQYRKVTGPLNESLSNYQELIKYARLFGEGRLRVN